VCSNPGCAGPGTEDPVVVQQWLDQSDAWFRETIRRHGWAVQAVAGDEPRRRPAFAYTVGLWGFGHPELVVVGLPQPDAHRLLNAVGGLVRAGETLRPGETVHGGPDDTDLHLRLLRLPNAHQVTHTAQRLYRPDGGQVVPALQLCWADQAGRYPWEPGFEHPRWLQPLPGTFAA